MFQSATLKLTGWYLLILMSISVIFSLSIYNIASHEVNDRLVQLQERIENGPVDIPLPSRLSYEALREAQYEQANHNLMLQLVYANIVILAAGGAGSYFLARRTLEPIEETHEAQARFVSDASHELKTPLAVMRTELEVALRDTSLQKKELRALLASNLEEVNKLSNLAVTLLHLSTLEHEELEKEPLDLNTIVQEIVHKYDKASRRIHFTPSQKPQLVEANRASLEELITILVDNALKYSPHGSLVATATSERSSQACFEITNTGRGISAEDLPHIFDRFYRANTARSKDGTSDGHGLGLSLAKKIVELHQGELLATSAPDHATTFTVLLPKLGQSPANPQ
jgi:signal transduction histidine kinase